MASKLKIIANTPKQTKDIKKTIKYLENIVINKETLKTLDTVELVKQINRLLQYVDILSEYKKPVINLLNEYQRTINVCNSPITEPRTKKKYLQRKEILDYLVSKSQINKIKFKEKEYWEKYE